MVFDFGTGSGRVVTKTSGSGTGIEKILKAENHISVPEWDKLLLRSCDVASRARAFSANESQQRENHREFHVAQICQ